MIGLWHDAFLNAVPQTRLGVREVHLWSAPLPAPPELIQEGTSLLSDRERAKAKGFHRQIDRDRYLTSHLLLRRLLSRYTGIRPDELRFHTNPFGKPSLEPMSDAENIQFNLSHAGDLALCGLTRLGRIGVDLEPIREPLEMLSIAHRFFTPGEAAKIEGLPPGPRERAFYACWTRKEAFVKARGDGLSFP